MKLYFFNTLALLSFFLFGTAKACISWQILQYYELIGNFGSTSILVYVDGVEACSGDASAYPGPDGAGYYLANCITDYVVILNTNPYPWVLDVITLNGVYTESIDNCNDDVTTISELASCFGDDGTC